MRYLIMLSTCLIFIMTPACNAAPAATPQIILVTKEIIITHEVALPTPEPVIITAQPPPTNTVLPPTQTQFLSHDWVDYGGICMRPDNIPSGVQINSDANEVKRTRAMILESLWRVINLNGSAEKLRPSFASASSLIQGMSQQAYLRGPFIPVGKQPPKSDAWSFTLEDPAILWGQIHPGTKFKGVALDTICFEFFPPQEFESQKQVDSQIHYIHLVGGVSHAKFDLEDILGSPRLIIKLYKNPYNGVREYKDLSGFAPTNTAAENVIAANEHVGAIIATFNTVLLGNFDGDGSLEFGFGPKNSVPLPVSSFQIVALFVPEH